VVADSSAREAVNLVAGANEPGFHWKNVNYGRDWQAEIVTDLALARAGHGCPRCSGVFEERRGIEMGHVFKLGTMYSEAMDVHYLNDAGEQRPAVMGCYGIGVERMLAAVIEANHDEDGIIWPPEVAPYDVHIVLLNQDEPDVQHALRELESRLEAAGFSSLIDDRDDSAGIDLLGMPIRLTVSPRSLKNGGIEFRNRRTKDSDIVPVDEVVTRIRVAALIREP
jgi:prolyl-tRNA synthetase